MTDAAFDAAPARPAAYGPTSRALHWAVAALFLGTLGIGLLFDVIPRGARAPRLDWHRAMGMGVLLLGARRLANRLGRGFPPDAAPAPRWQEAAARAGHWALLAVTLLMPLTGILMGLARGRALDMWGFTLLPAMPETPWLATAAGAVHEALPWALVALIALHVGGALKHHLVDRDATIKRMTHGRVEG